jgi:predicted branched-subunit amino acid permease
LSGSALSPARARRRERFLQGVRWSYAGVLSTFVWGIIAGVAMLQSGMTVAQAIGMTLLVFSGTAQLAALPLMVSGASLALIALTTLLTSMRFLIYSASVSHDLSRLRPGLRSFAGYLTTDSGLAVFQMLRAAERRAQRTALYLGLNVPVWISWQIGSFLGIAAVTLSPPERDLAYLGTLAVLAMIAQAMRSRFAWPTAMVAALVALLGTAWPYRSGMLLAIACGVMVPIMLERVARTARTPS